jgi:hypothetical protein
MLFLYFLAQGGGITQGWSNTDEKLHLFLYRSSNHQRGWDDGNRDEKYLQHSGWKTSG